MVFSQSRQPSDPTTKCLARLHQGLSLKPGLANPPFLLKTGVLWTFICFLICWTHELSFIPINFNLPIFFQFLLGSSEGFFVVFLFRKSLAMEVFKICHVTLYLQQGAHQSFVKGELPGKERSVNFKSFFFSESFSSFCFKSFLSPSSPTWLQGCFPYFQGGAETIWFSLLFSQSGN